MNALFEGWQRSWWAQAFQNRLIALVLAMIVAVPLLAAPADYSLTGMAALTLESFSVLLLTVLLWRARFDLRRENVLAFVRTSANVPILLLLGWVTLSTFLSPHKVFSLQFLLQTGAGALLYFAVAYQFRQSKHLSLLADVLLFLSLIVALGGLAQYQFAGEAEGRARALFGDSQALGSFVALLLPVVAGLAFVDTKPKRQTIAQVTFVLMVGALLLTQGRSAWLASAVAMGVFALLSQRLKAASGDTSSNLPLKARKHQLVLPALIAFITVGFVGAMHMQNANVLGRATTFSSLSTDESWQARLQGHWKGSVEMISERPLMGWGAGLYPVYQQPYSGQGAEISATGTGTRVSLAEQAHNFYLQTAAELGLPGLVLTLSVLVGFWVAGWKRLSGMDAGIRRTLLMGSIAATAGFAVDAVGSPSWQYAQTSMFLWLVLGMGTSCVRPRLRRDERDEQAVSQVSPVVSRRVTLAMRPIAVCTALTLATLLPTAVSSAQGQGYNPPGRGRAVGRTFEVAFGLAAVGAVYFLLTGAGSGAAAGAAAGVGSAGAGSGGPGGSPGGGPGGAGQAQTDQGQNNQNNR